MENRNLHSGLNYCNKDELKLTHPLLVRDRVKPIFNLLRLCSAIRDIDKYHQPTINIQSLSSLRYGSCFGLVNEDNETFGLVSV